MDSFEKEWCEWSVDDTLKWFEFVLSDKTDSDDDDDDDDNDETEDEKQETNEEIDFEHVKSRLYMIGFNSKKEFPILVKQFQFERFGFKNKKDRKILCKKAKQLIQKYPKTKSKKSKKKQGGRKQKDVGLEGFVQDTN